MAQFLAVLMMVLPIMQMPVFAAVTAQAPTAGSGTFGSPYQIATAGNLLWLAQNNTYWSSSYYFRQTDNIDISGISNWTPIGNGTAQFGGTYDGNGFAVNGLNISNVASLYQGLFGRTNNATIKNLGVTNVNIDEDISGADYVGALVGYAYCSSGGITNCYSTGNVTGNFVYGGLVGRLDFGTISNSFSTCTLSGDTSYNFGGFIGYIASGTVYNCYSSGDYSLTKGGLFAGCNGGTVTNCFTTGTNSGGANVGILCNNNTSGATLSNSYAAVSGPAYITNNGTVNNVVTGKGDAFFKSVSNFTGGNYNSTYPWNFSSIWAIDTSGVRNNGYPYLIESQMAPGYTITYDGNGASGSAPASIIAPQNSLYIVQSSGGLTKQGCTFSGYWNTKPDGSGTLYHAGGTGTMGTANVTLYAQWTPSSSSSVTPQAPTAGSGTSGSPYQIATAGNLLWLAQNSGYWGSTYYYRQTANIDISAIPNWTSIGGNGAASFNGTYDGNGFSINGLNIINVATYDLGLFGYLANGTIKNLGVTNVNINENIPGVTGIGPLVGYSNGGTITNCYSTGNVVGNTNYGGLIGRADFTTISNSFSTCTISGAPNWGGGFTGYLAGGDTVYNCYSAGDMYTTGAAGLFAGLIDSNNTVTNCFTTGTNYGGANVGTLINYVKGTLTYSYAAASGPAFITNNGGMVLVVTDNKGAAFFKSSSNFTGGNYNPSYPWNFSSIWAIDSSGIINNGYPYLQYSQIASSHTVTYDANGATSGSAPNDNGIYFQGATATVRGNTGNLAKTNCTFPGWNTQADGHGTDYAAGANLTMGTSNVTLYAKWTANTFTVTYDSNGGSSVESQTVNYNTTATEPTPPTETGFTFAGWYTDNTTFNNAFNFSTPITGDITLYAKWISALPTGTLSINSGAAATNSINVALSISGTDPQAYPMQMRFSNDGSSWSTWEAYATSKSWTLSTGDDLKTVYMQLQDDHGNTSANIAASIALDTVAPVVTGIADGGIYNSNRTITFNEGTATLNSVGFNSGGTVSAENTYTFVVTDSAGNVTTVHFTIDKTPPVISGVTEGGAYNGGVAPTFTEGTGKLDGANYTSGTNIAAAGTHTLVVTDTAGNTSTVNFTVTQNKPVVTGILDGGIYNTAKTVTVSDGTSTLSKDGGTAQAFTSGSSVSDDGSYVLAATNAAGTTTVNFKIDKTAPTVSGVADGGSYAVSPTITFSDEVTTPTATLAKNGGTAGAFTSGTNVSAVGNYTLVVSDQAGNSSTVNFTVTGLPPVVSGVVNNGLYNTDCTITFDSGIATLDNGGGPAAFASGTTVSADGSYTLAVTNPGGTTTVHFTIDKTPPTVTGVSDGGIYAGTLTITYSDNLAVASATMDGSPLTSGDNISTEGSHTLIVTDTAGNSRTINFAIDNNPPVVLGVTEGGSYNHSVTISFDSGTATLDNGGGPVALTSGTTVSVDGSYTLIVTKGTGVTTTRTFIIDTVVPSIGGVSNGTSYTSSATPTFSDNNPGVTATLDGASFTSGTPVTALGSHTLVVTDAAGNSSTVNFIVNPPAPEIDGVTDGGIYNHDVMITFSSGTATLSKNGGTAVEFSNNSQVTGEGSYTLVVDNGTAVTVNFTIDKTFPVVTGVTNGGVYSGDRTISFSDDATAVTATLDGLSFNSGNTVTAEGTHVLVVTDAAGNATTVNFIIDKTAPSVTGAVNGGKYNQPVTIYYNKGTATLDSSSFICGGSVSAEGSHTLIATNAAGVSTTINFTIDTTPPTVTGVSNGGSYDLGGGDVAIGFSDALTTATATLARDGGTAGNFVSGSNVTNTGSYALVVTDGVGNSTTINFTVTSNPPVVSGAVDGGIYNTNRSISFNNGSATLAKDGGTANPFAGGSQVTDDGNYTLIVTNSAGTTTVNFAIDKTAPVVTGISDGDSYDLGGGNKIISYSDAVTTPTATLSKDGGPAVAFSSNSSVTSAGNYVLVVIDGAGNSTTINFTVTSNPPLVSGVVNGGHYNTDRAVSFNNGSATLDNGGGSVAFTSGDTVSAEGTYTLTVTNGAGTTTVSFIIDKTAPVISGVTEGGSYDGGVTVSFNEGTAELDGNPFAAGTITVSGAHVLVVTDDAGNSTTVNFTITNSAPAVIGVSENGIYNTDKTIHFSGGTATLDNGSGAISFNDGYVVSSEGSYTLAVTNASGTTTIHFIIDKTPPAVTGITDGETYTSNKVITYNDALTTATATLDGSSFASGDTATGNGSHTLVVTDGAGNSTTVNFTINIASDSSINPTTARFDKKASAQEDIPVTVTLNGNTLTSITNAGTPLTSGTDYTVAGNVYTINKEYLAAQPVGATNLSFNFSAGNPQPLAVTITDTTPSPAYPESSTGSNNESGNTDILVNGETRSNTATSTTTTDANGQATTTVTLDDSKMAEILDTLPDNGSNPPVLTIPAGNGADAVVGELNGQMVKNMEAKNVVIEIKTDLATYTIPAEQIRIDEVSAKLGTQVELKDITVHIEISKPSAEAARVVENSAKSGEFMIVAQPVEFTVKCTHGDKTVDVSLFNSYVERMIPIPDGVDPAKITTAVVVNADGTVRHVPTQIVIIDGKYYAKINSLTNSTYTVIYNPVGFKDVANHWAKAAVNDMGSRLVISGAGNDMFEPDRDITRAEFAAIIVRALGLNPGTGSNPFTDVSNTAWYCDYIKTAVEYKLISGYGNGTFGPNDKITREQAMTMIARAMNITGLKVQFENREMDKLLAGFGDSAESADYAKNSIAACVKTGIISGRNGNLIAPKDNITRAEVAVIVQRLLQKSGLI